jgi:hypothetical protein
MSTLTSAAYTHDSEVSSSTRTIAAAITPTRLTTPNQRRWRRVDISTERRENEHSGASSRDRHADGGQRGFRDTAV